MEVNKFSSQPPPPPPTSTPSPLSVVVFSPSLSQLDVQMQFVCAYAAAFERWVVCCAWLGVLKALWRRVEASRGEARWEWNWIWPNRPSIIHAHSQRGAPKVKIFHVLEVSPVWAHLHPTQESILKPSFNKCNYFFRLVLIILIQHIVESAKKKPLRIAMTLLSHTLLWVVLHTSTFLGGFVSSLWGNRHSRPYARPSHQRRVFWAPARPKQSRQNRWLISKNPSQGRNGRNRLVIWKANL